MRTHRHNGKAIPCMINGVSYCSYRAAMEDLKINMLQLKKIILPEAEYFSLLQKYRESSYKKHREHKKRNREIRQEISIIDALRVRLDEKIAQRISPFITFGYLEERAAEENWQKGKKPEPPARGNRQ